MTHLETNPNDDYIPTEAERTTWEQLQIDRGAAILDDEEHRNEWARR